MDQKAKLPKELTKALADAAASMEQMFKNVGHLNLKEGNPIPERNLVVHVGAALIAAGFSVYAEPRLPASEGNKAQRIDLLASNKTNSFVFEAKSFGARDFERLMLDMKRLIRFRPQAVSFTDGHDPVEFWRDANRWGVILVLSLQTREFKEIWEMQVRDKVLFETLLASYPHSLKANKNGGTNAWKDFAQELRNRSAVAGCEKILETGFWANSDADLDLIWAAFPIPDAT